MSNNSSLTHTEFLQEVCATLQTVYNVPDGHESLPQKPSGLKGTQFTLLGAEAISKTMATSRFVGTPRDDIVCVFEITKPPTQAKPSYTRPLVLPMDAPPTEKFQSKTIPLTKVHKSVQAKKEVHWLHN